VLQSILESEARIFRFQLELILEAKSILHV